MSKNKLTMGISHRLAKDLLIGIFLFCILNWGGKSFVQSYLMQSNYLYDKESNRVERFQQYVTEHQLNLTDTEEIRSWVDENNIREFILSRDEEVYFDNTYQENFFKGALRKNYVQILRQITFHDGQAYLYLYSGWADLYYNMITGASAILSMTLAFLIFASEFQDEIQEIQYLSNKVAGIGSGNFTEEIITKREDELGQLSAGIDAMRQQLLRQKEYEAQLKQAQDELVLGMAHDLRTPLTGLFSYLEIIRKLEQEGKPALLYTEKSIGKAKQLENVADQLFEFFFVSSEDDMEMEEAETTENAFGDYLSEFCISLQCMGFAVITEDIVWKPYKVRLCLDFWGRIMNNLISNIQKYANQESPIHIGTIYTDTHVILKFANHTIKPNPYVKGTGIGLRNIEVMMTKMGGSLKKDFSENEFTICLSFPIVKS